MNKKPMQLPYLKKMEGKVIKKCGFYILLILLLSGCVGNISGIHVYNTTNEDSKRAEQILEKEDRLRNAFVVFQDEDLLAGVTVGTFARFHKDKIEKKLKKELKEEYPDAHILVSADSKIVVEIMDLLEIKDENKLEKEITHVKTHSEEET